MQMAFERMQISTQEKMADVWQDMVTSTGTATGTAGTTRYYIAEGGVPHVGGPILRDVQPNYSYPFLFYSYDTSSKKLSFIAYWDANAVPACWKYFDSNVRAEIDVRRVA